MFPDIDAQALCGNTAIHEAIENGHADVAKALLIHGADMQIPNNEALPPLHLAVTKTNVHVIKVSRRLP